MSALDFGARGLAVQAIAAADAAARLAQLKALRLVEPAAILAAPPRLSARTAASLTPVEVIGKDDARLSYAHAGFGPRGAAAPLSSYNVPSWITSAGLTGPGFGSVRFLSDAPQLEFYLGGYTANYTLFVDGQPVARSAQFAPPNDGSFQYLLVDFGADVQGIRPFNALVSGGSGHAIGDVLTITGGTGAAYRLVVSGIDGNGAVTAFYIRDFGNYSALPASPAASTSSGTGTGATFNLTAASPARSLHSTRRVRRFELLSDGGSFGGVRVGQHGIVRPWPVAGPRLLVMQDSYVNTFVDYPAGGWAWRLAQRLAIEDLWANGLGGTGFLAVNSGNSWVRYRDRLPDIVAAAGQVAAATPVVHLVQGSINDQPFAPVDLQAEAFAYWNLAFQQLPGAYMVQTGILRGPANTISDAHSAAVRAGFLAAQAIHDATGARSGFIETRTAPFGMMTVGGRAGATTGGGATDFWIAGDGAHPTQAGHDYIGDLWAADLLGIVRGW